MNSVHSVPPQTPQINVLVTPKTHSNLTVPQILTHFSIRSKIWSVTKISKSDMSETRGRIHSETNFSPAVNQWNHTCDYLPKQWWERHRFYNSSPKGLNQKEERSGKSQVDPRTSKVISIRSSGSGIIFFGYILRPPGQLWLQHHTHTQVHAHTHTHTHTHTPFLVWVSFLQLCYGGVHALRQRPVGLAYWNQGDAFMIFEPPPVSFPPHT